MPTPPPTPQNAKSRICRETTCQTVTFLEHSEKVCAPRARLGTRAIQQLRFEGATILGLARQ